MAISALEIGDNYLRAIRLGRKGNNLIVQKSAQTSIENGLISGGRVVAPEKFAHLLANFLKTNRFSEYRWIVSLSCKDIFTTYKTFPNLAHGDLNEAVEINLPSLLPGETSEISWGWQEIEPTKKIAAEHAKMVMISSMLQKDLTSFLGAFSVAGIVPVAIEPKSLSISRVLGNQKPTLVLDLEGLNVTVVVISAGFPRFAREFHLPPAEKEQFKSLLSEVRRAMNFYLTESKEAKIETIILDGPSANPEIAQALGTSLNQEVKLSRDLVKVSGASGVTLSIFGAGIRALTPPEQDTSLSLLPVGAREAAQEQRALLFYGGLANIIVITTILFLLLFIGTWGFIKYLTLQADSQLASLSQKQASQDSKTKEMQNSIKEINSEITLEASLEDQMTFFSPVLEGIYNAKGAGVQISNIDYSKENQPITLTGTASSREALASFRDALAAESFIEQVQMPSSNFGENQNILFTMTLTLKKDALKNE